MTVNWNPEDVQVSLTMDKGFKTVYSKNSINYPLMCSFLVMLAFHTLGIVNSVGDCMPVWLHLGLSCQFLVELFDVLFSVWCCW